MCGSKDNHNNSECAAFLGMRGFSYRLIVANKRKLSIVTSSWTSAPPLSFIREKM